MGLFSTKKTITVSSVLYNMAGDEDSRPDFLKGVIFGSIMANSPSLADDMTTSYFGGPGMKQRLFFRYADRNDMSGLPLATIENNIDVDPSVVEGEIPVSPTPSGLSVECFSAGVIDGEFEPWIERWILENYPSRYPEDWLGEYDPGTNMFSVEFPNNDYYSWSNNVAPIYDFEKRYIAARYVETFEATEDAVVEGIPSIGVLTPPDLTGWELVSDTDTSTPVTLQRTRTTIWTYSDSTPDFTFEDEVDADTSGVLNTATEVWKREISLNLNGVEVEGERQIWNLTGTDTVVGGYSSTVVTYTDLGGGVTRTETATTTGEQILPSWTTRYDTQSIYLGTINGNERIFLYEVGTGNTTLDALVDTADASAFQEFYPFMPIRINNVSILEDQYSDLYLEMKAGYRRAYQGKSFKKLVEKVEDNESIDDIDFAYLIFGCSLNVKEMKCRKYIYKFFEKMIPYLRDGHDTAIADLQTQVTNYNNVLAQFEAWLAANYNAEAWATIVIPPKPAIKLPPTNTLRLNDADLGFDVRTSWIDIKIDQFSGTFDVDPITAGHQTPKVDDCLIVKGPTVSWTERLSYNMLTGSVKEVDREVDSIYIYWQVTSNTYRRMHIWGLVHNNYVYGGKAVNITTTAALDDTEESGFFIPLHYPTFSEMGIVDYTQMSTANAHILFNCYEITKQRWYENALFQILIVIVVIVIAVVAFPGLFAGAGGILGGNLAVGTALGLTGTAAILAGVIANYIAAILISEVLKAVGTALLGEKWGAVFAAVAGFALTAGMSGADLLSSENLLAMGNALANGYKGYVEGEMAEMASDLEDYSKHYEKQMEYIQNLIEGLGGNDLNFNPLSLTDGGIYGNGRSSSGYMPESADEFIQRTTMTGTDVVELTLAMVNDFVNIKQTLPRN